MLESELKNSIYTEIFILNPNRDVNSAIPNINPNGTLISESELNFTHNRKRNLNLFFNRFHRI